MTNHTQFSNEEEKLKSLAKQVYETWDKALAENDIQGLLNLYAPDALLESPLIPYLLKVDSGVISGKEALLSFIEKIAARKPVIRKYFKQNFFTDGKTLIFEYPRQSPEGEQMDFVEIMEIENGLIHYHRVYWGWRGVKVIQEDSYYR